MLAVGLPVIQTTTTTVPLGARFPLRVSCYLSSTPSGTQPSAQPFPAPSTLKVSFMTLKGSQPPKEVPTLFVDLHLLKSLETKNPVVIDPL